MGHKLVNFIHWPTEQKLLWLEAIIWLALARVTVRFIPFRLFSPWLGRRAAPDTTALELLTAEEHQTTLVSQVIRSAAFHVPWQAVCLPQAMAAASMLRRRNIPCCLYLGLSKSDTDLLNAHAWVRAGQQIVTGDEDLHTFTVISTFR